MFKLFQGWVKSVSSFDCSAGYCLVVIIEDGTRALQVKVNPKVRSNVCACLCNDPYT